jgi:hypothetical protein
MEPLNAEPLNANERIACDLQEPAQAIQVGYYAIFGGKVVELDELVSWLGCGALQNATDELDSLRELVDGPLCPVGGVYVYTALYRLLAPWVGTETKMGEK